ncbi:MAG: pantoate--beta-alanine ligase [Dehalococcoidales bacterium]|nr:MAG: pantoate--beta-alanine ligase [Dehalococcoidales bacterium]
MQVVETTAGMRKLRDGLAEPVGLVPTMGYLHEGHLSLVKQARSENPSVVASIFVNPTQFGPKEDFESYPRDTERDLAMLESAGTDVVFMPSARDMYPEPYHTWVEVDTITQRLEGASRPTHFRGVTTVCTKLFNIIKPDKAYFGQKDAQQAIVINRMVTDLNMNLKVVTCPTLREDDGLAMSSRNTYLNPEERKAAAILYQSLCLAQQLWAEGEKDAERIRQEIRTLIQKQPLANIDYISIADNETLEELDEIRLPALVSLAVKIGKPRLLDNIVLE